MTVSSHTGSNPVGRPVAGRLHRESGASLSTESSRLILLASGVAQQIVAQPDDVLLHDGELVT
jgi:hypothetical protein